MWEKIAIENAQLYANDMERFLSMVRESEPFRYVLLMVYGEFLKQNKIVCIEKLDEGTFREVYNRSLEWRPEELDRNKRNHVCRIIWLMNCVFDKYFV